MRKIDMHVHCFHIQDTPRAAAGRRLPTPAEVREMYDALGIEKGVLMSGGASPECAAGTISTREVRQMAELYADTVGWWFCPVDPRNIRNHPSSDFLPLLRYYREQGAVGVSEMSANIPLDDPRFISLFTACAALKMPVTLHFGVAERGYGVVDDLHLPRLERVLNACPGLILIGHSPIWWNEIGDDVTDENREQYITTPLAGEGRVQTLLRRYPNLHCDLSAMSAYIALQRDVCYSHRFLEEFQNQILYATDIASPDALSAPFMKMGSFLDDSVRSGKISGTAYEKICRGNALRLLAAGAGV